MKTDTKRPNRRPRLHLPLFLETAMRGEAEPRRSSFPMTSDQLRRSVAEMIG
jgi:hypothetical protein